MSHCTRFIIIFGQFVPPPGTFYCNTSKHTQDPSSQKQTMLPAGHNSTFGRFGNSKGSLVLWIPLEIPLQHLPLCSSFIRNLPMDSRNATEPILPSSSHLYPSPVTVIRLLPCEGLGTSSTSLTVFRCHAGASSPRGHTHPFQGWREPGPREFIAQRSLGRPLHTTEILTSLTATSISNSNLPDTNKGPSSKDYMGKIKMKMLLT